MKVSVQSVGGPEPPCWLAFVHTLTMSLGSKMHFRSKRALREIEVLLSLKRLIMGVKDCFNIYNQLLNKKYILHIEDDLKLELTFSKDNLKHLLGLHKLSDVTFTNNEALVVYNLIKKGIINDSILRKSIKFPLIEERILYFHIIPILLQSKIIIDFDPSKIPDKTYTSKLQKTKYILYNHLENGFVAHLTLAERACNTSKYYPETFFIEHSNMYISDQELKDIIKIEIVSL